MSHDTKLPPQNLDAEASVLACIMLDRGQSIIDEIAQILPEQCFYRDDNRIIYGCMCSMRRENKPIDTISLANELQKRGKLEEIGGPQRLMELMEVVPHTAHWEHYCKIVKEAAQRRGLIDVGMAAVRRAYNESEDVAEVFADTESALHSAMADGLTARPLDIGPLIEQALKNCTDPPPEKPRYIQTSMERARAYSPGYLPGAINIIAARPSMGKTAFALSDGHAAARAGRSVLICSYEQQPIEIVQRLLALESRIDFTTLTQHISDEPTLHAVFEAASRLGKLKIQIDCSCPPQSRLSALIRIQARRGTELVIIDYLQLIEADDRRAPREQQVAGITRALKRVAMDVGVPIVALSQLNREVEKRADQKPRLSDLRESGAVEQDADQVWLLHRPGANPVERTDGKGNTLPTIEDNFGILNIAKHRNGRTGETRLLWEPSVMRYSAETVDPFGGKC